MALLTEGTYPYVDGGVSTWCHTLCQELPSVDYSIYGVTGSTAAQEVYTRTPNLVRVTQIPQWGTEDIVEYVQPGVNGWPFLRRKLTTGRSRNLRDFLDPFGDLMAMILRPTTEPTLDTTPIIRLHRFFQEFDYTSAFRAPATWDCFRERCLDAIRADPMLSRRTEPSALDLAVCLRWLHNLLMPIAVPVPEVDLMHGTMAGVVSLIGVIARATAGIPFALTDHGVYVRERYISVSPGPMAWFMKRILIGLAAVSSRACYAIADIVAPVCAFNTRWESRLGVPADRLRVIYNGVDPDIFRPQPKPPELRNRPTAVAAARISHIKDILTLIRGTAVARRELPNLLVRVYGSLNADPPYVRRCRDLIAELELDGTFELAGFHSTPSEIYNEGDISVLSSISEGFPYTVLESMSCERPVVATDVGGVREALDGFGVVVPPKDPEALGRGIAALLKDPLRRLELGRRSREQVLARYRTDQSANAYLKLYREMHDNAGWVPKEIDEQSETSAHAVSAVS